jgi:RNA polymerase sigma-70 factor (ECF subfamily)
VTERDPLDERLQRSARPGVEGGVTSSWIVERDLRLTRAGAPPRPSPLQPAGARAEATDLIADAYEAYQRDIHSFLRAATRDVETAEDLTQEAFIRLVKEVHAGRTPDNIRAWLYTVAANLVTSRARRASVAERFRSILAIRGSAEAPEGEALRRETADEVHQALRRLPADARAALLLAAHGFSGREIAGVLGRTDGATRTLLCRARVRLREQLGPGASAADPLGSSDPAGPITSGDREGRS